MKESTLYKFQIVFTIVVNVLVIGAVVGILPQEILYYRLPILIWIGK